MDATAVGKQILILRKRNGYTQEELAERLDISAQAISKWENGHTLPETAMLPDLARLFNCSIDAILSPVIMKEGAVISFGRHKWRVLQTDGNSALLLAESVIEQRAYHEEFTQVTWEHCDLRKYLNKQFYESFDTSDRVRILETRLTGSDNPWYGTEYGNATMDKIFLLSIAEVLQFLGDSGDVQNSKRWYWEDDKRLVPSDAAHWECGECVNDRFNDARKALYHKVYNAGWDERWWWLRSPGIHVRHTTACIGEKGELFVCGGDVYDPRGGVRPAMWIGL